MDLEIADLIALRKGFYCELGAYDGVRQSNTLHLEMFRGWRGVLIEPVSENFQLLIRNRSSRRNRLVRAASVGFDFVGLEMPIAVGGLMSTPMVGKSDISDPKENAAVGRQNQRRFAGTEAEPPIEMSPALTLTRIFDENQCPREIDLLSLDVEGGEIEVLSGLDFDKYRVEWIVVESRNPSDMVEYLASSGYVLVRSLTPIDFVFRRTAA